MGGWKDSGIGYRHGDTGIRKFCRAEAIVITRFGGKRELLWFPYTGSGAADAPREPFFARATGAGASRRSDRLRGGCAATGLGLNGRRRGPASRRPSRDRPPHRATIRRAAHGRRAGDRLGAVHPRVRSRPPVIRRALPVSISLIRVRRHAPPPVSPALSQAASTAADSFAQPMSVLFEHRLPIAGFQTRALELDGEGPPLILLHGWSDSADTWRPCSTACGAAARGRSRSTCRATAPPPGSAPISRSWRSSTASFAGR